MGEHVRRVAQENENVKVHVRYSQPSPEDLIGRDYDDPGHIDIELVKRVVPDTNRDFYLCGPTPFMKSLFDGLLERLARRGFFMAVGTGGSTPWVSMCGESLKKTRTSRCTLGTASRHRKT